MKKNQKVRKITIKVLAVSISGLLLFGSGAYAVTQLLNWTGDQTMVSAGIFIDQVTKKLVKNETNKVELEKEIEDLKQQIKDLEDEINNSNDSDEGWTEKDQQIIDLNNQLIEKENQLISKQNDVEHLTRELQRANSTAITIQEKLDNSNAVLEQNGINIWN